MFGEKKFIDEKYVDLLLQLAWKYKHENPHGKDTVMYAAMDKVLETMDKYVATINNMGYMMHVKSMEYMLCYMDELLEKGCEYSREELVQAKEYLKEKK